MEDLYFKTLTDFLTSLKNVFPEKRDIIEKQLDEMTPYKISDVQNFLSKAKPYYVEISNSDSSIFHDNPVLEFYPNLNFSELWKLGISDNTKANIWTHLQTLVLLSFVIVSKSKNITDLLDKMKKVISKKKDNDNTVSQAQSIINISERLQSQKPETQIVTKELFPDLTDEHDLSDDDEKSETNNKSSSKSVDSSDNNVEDDLGFDPSELFEGTKIGQLAKEIAEEIDVNNLGLGDLENSQPDNIQDAFSKILGNNPAGLMNTVQKIGSKVQEKIGKSGLSQQQMAEEAQDMMKNMHQTPMFKDMFQDSEMGPMFQQMTQMMSQMQKNQSGGKGAPPFNPFNMANNPFQTQEPKSSTNSQSLQQLQQQLQSQQHSSRSNSTRERLQKKLQQRKQEKQDKSGSRDNHETI